MSKSQKPKKGNQPKQNTGRQPIKKESQELSLPLGMRNYILILVGLLMIILGYIFMSGKNDIYNFTKLSLSVIFVIGGFFFIVLAIMWNGRKK